MTAGANAAAPIEETDLTAGLSAAEARKRLETFGPNALEEHRVSPLKKLAGYFWGPIPWMIEAAAVLSALDAHWADLAIILVLLLFNAGVGFWQERKADDALAALKNQLALRARALRDGKWAEIDAADLVPGDVIRIRLGDVIPADVRLREGAYLSIDQAALTGESLPVAKKPGEDAYSGSIAKQGEMVAQVIATGANTFFGRTAKLVEGAGAVSHFQRAVLRIGDFLILVALVLSAVLILVELFRGESPARLLQFVLILVVASIPVAMPAVLSVTMALGALALSKKKAIVSRLQSIEEMAGIDILCSDKTGTLTQNKLTLGDPELFAATDAPALILAGALASKAEDKDAIDLAVIGGLNEAALAGYTQTAFTPFDPVGKRTQADVTGPQGAFRVSKGAPQVILGLCAPDDATITRAKGIVDALATKGFRTLGVARSDDAGQSWVFLGILPLFDPPREDSAQTIAEARAHGIEVKMVTGDDTAIGREISGKLGLGTNIRPATDLFGSDGTQVPADAAEQVEAADGFARVFPEHKYRIVKALQDRGHLVGMTGDGVNDSPAIKQADVGIAVSGATDAARAAADLILTTPGLSTIISAVEEARRIFERMTSYTIYRIAMTIDIMLFVVLAMLIFGVYPLTAVMIILLALLDDIPIMTIAYDNTWLSKKPVRWNMPWVLGVSSLLGFLSVIQTFGLMYLGKIPFAMDTPHLQTMIFLQLVVGGHLMLFVTRNRKSFWRKPYPAWPLVSAILATQVLAVLMTGFGWLMPALPWHIIALVWVYNLVWMVVLDFAKLGADSLMGHRPRFKQVLLDKTNRPLFSHGAHRHS
ncbi:plasma-membrane proton-efflux P-type ATPase [Thioclava sp. 15-R06ZXC-3]|uniref:Plasma-membrane proton-efflux P-type ATPase n=1 Tax=Thioclava arctica TaxID=3238301 RepID=A0ABV3TK13_9RHOB